MLNEKWHRKLLRTKTSSREFNGVDITTESDISNKVKSNEKIMNYFINKNFSGYENNLEALIASLNIHQHTRDAILNSELIEEKDCYKINFVFGDKLIEYKISKKSVDNLNDS